MDFRALPPTLHRTLISGTVGKLIDLASMLPLRRHGSKFVCSVALVDTLLNDGVHTVSYIGFSFSGFVGWICCGSCGKDTWQYQSFIIDVTAVIDKVF